ncbi:Arm DNA-binding domain-containing protein [Acinetobacter lanii]
MANIQERYGKLVVDFRYQGIRFRETTNLELRIVSYSKNV